MFIDTSQFPWVAALEGDFALIRDECLALKPKAFQPWVQREMYGQGWSVYGLIAFGQRIDAALAQCPATADLLGQIPGLTTAGFSRLAGGAHIQAHVGWVTSVYRGHLGLVVPEQCALRVGSETRPWQPGHCLVFDDTIEHEAWNRSTDDRLVLLFDFLRPGCEPQSQDLPPEEVRDFVRRTTRPKPTGE
jgi:ornithine lipid ester-linked acyl 2-hydroxylase